LASVAAGVGLLAGEVADAGLLAESLLSLPPSPLQAARPAAIVAAARPATTLATIRMAARYGPMRTLSVRKRAASLSSGTE
jgi:hypothetical protein